MLAEPAGLEVLRLYGEARGDVLSHAVEPFALLGREGIVRVALFQPCLIPLAQFFAVGHERLRGDKRITHEVDEIGEHISPTAFDLARLYCFEGAPELDRRRGKRRTTDGVFQLAQLLERELKGTCAGIEHLQCSKLLLVLIDPFAEILHLHAGFFHRSSVEAYVEHIINSVSVYGLLILLADFEYATAEGGLEKRRDRILRQLVRCLADLLVCWLGHAELLFRCLDLRVWIGGIKQAVREVGE